MSIYVDKGLIGFFAEMFSDKNETTFIKSKANPLETIF